MGSCLMARCHCLVPLPPVGTGVSSARGGAAAVRTGGWFGAGVSLGCAAAEKRGATPFLQECRHPSCRHGRVLRPWWRGGAAAPFLAP